MESIFASSSSRRFFYLIISVLVLLNFFGLFGELMEADAALYASIAKTISMTNDWANLYVNSADWLDKPHLPFWFAALSFKVFGISAFAYKFPSFLISLVGFWYLYKLAKVFYDEKVALIAVIICMSALHSIISNYDVRAEGYLSTFALAAIYHFYKARNSSFIHLVVGALFSALAVMVKGIFVLIPVLGGFIVYWIFTKQYAEFTKLKWYLAVLLIFVFIFPELWSLYLQFDLHPEKVIFGETQVSGLQFFFWDSQFGRFFNNGPIKGRGEPSFFIHTTLWAFLPWSIPLVAALVQLTKKKVRQIQDPAIIIIWGSAGLTFLIFSLSKFQLPHYIIIIFPQLAMITAHYISGLTDRQQQVFGRINAVLGVLILLILVTVAYFLQVAHVTVFYVVALSLIGLIFVRFKEQSLIKNAMLSCVALFIFLYGFFYPTILKYQSGLQAAKWMAAHQPNLKAGSLDFNAFAFDFYSKAIVKHVDFRGLSRLPDRNRYAFYVKDEILEDLKKHFPVKILAKFEYFRITKLKPKFINAKTRSEVLTHFYLVKIN